MQTHFTISNLYNLSFCMSIMLYACAQRRTSWLYYLGFQHILQRNLSKLVQCAHDESCRRLSSASINNQITTMKTSNRKFQKLHWNNFIFLKQNKIKSNQFLCKNEKLVAMHSIICTKNVYEALSNFDIIVYEEPKNSPVATRLVGFLQLYPFLLILGWTWKIPTLS